jgi:hypothetical protein
MTTVSIVFPKNRLTSLLRKPGGLSVSAALEAAEANLVNIRTEVVAEVDRALELIAHAALAAAEPESGGDARREVYECAQIIAGLAGTGGLEDIGEAALNLCKLTDAYIHEGYWNAEAVSVHLSVMGLLRSSGGEGDAALRRCIMAELSTLVEHAPTVKQSQVNC